MEIKKTKKPVFNNRENTMVWASRSCAVVGVVFAFGVEGGSKVLRIKRSIEMPDEPLKYALPSGYLDWDESAFDGMVREVYEETSLYLPDYNPFLINNNYEQPFFVQSDPTAHRQNVSLYYLMVYDFTSHQNFFPKEIETYSDSETEKVEWLGLQNFYNKEDSWAFHHNEMIEKAMRYYKKVGERK